MIKTDELNEININQAFSQGYITKKEAQNMLDVYLNKRRYSKQKSQTYKSLILHTWCTIPWYNLFTYKKGSYETTDYIGLVL